MTPDLDKIADDLGLPRDKFRAGVQRIQREQEPVAEVVGALPDGDAVLDRPLPEGTGLFTFPPATPSAVPDGWQLVPKEPTPEMIEAGNDGFRNPDSRRHTVSSCYRAMLSAAPAPAGEKKQCTCDEHGACANCCEGRTGKPAGEKGER